MQIKRIDKAIAEKYSDRIIELLDEVLDINNVVVDKNYSLNLVSEMGKFIDDGSAYIVGAFDDEKLIGFIWCYRRIFNQEERLHIYHFIVDKTCRGAGVGQQLINTAFTYAQENNISKIDLMATSSNKQALNFYYKNKFVDERLLLSRGICCASNTPNCMEEKR